MLQLLRKIAKKTHCCRYARAGVRFSVEFESVRFFEVPQA